MRLLVLGVAIAVCFSQIACQRVKNSLEGCPNGTAPIAGSGQTPATLQEYHDVLTRYFENRSKVEYGTCIRDSQAPRFSGKITWTRDGAEHERLDLSPTDGTTPITYLATRVQSYICSPDLGKYIARLFSGADKYYRDAIQPFAANGSGCMPDPYPTSACDPRCIDEDVIRPLGVPNPLKIDLATFKTMTLPAPKPLLKSEQQIAGRHATCFSTGECFGDDGTLLSARSYDSVLEAKSVSQEVSDSDFSLPFVLRTGS